MNTQADVLIVTDIRIVSKAVLEVFQETTGQLPQPTLIDGHIYHDLGEVNTTKVFMVQSEIGSKGVEYTVQNGIAALSPSAVIMVSLALGASQYSQSIGDVLVSQQLVICDLHPTWQEEIKKIKPGDVIPEIMPRNERPYASPWLINRFRSAEMYWDGSKAKIHIGSILSIDAIIANDTLRDQLLMLSPRAIGVEIGGTGLYMACQDKKIDWILVEAISDLGDFQKNDPKDIQVATRNSASYVLHTLQLAPLRRDTTYAKPPLHQPSSVNRWGNSPDLSDLDYQVDLGIVIALDEEFQELFPQIEARPVFNKENTQYYYLFERKKVFDELTPYRCVTTFIGGMGPTRAALVADRLLDQFKPTTLVNIGIAGSMDKDVFVGDVVVAEQTDEYLSSSKAIDVSNENDWDIQMSGDPYKSEPGYIRHAQNLKYAFPNTYQDWLNGCRSRLEGSINQATREELLHKDSIRESPQIHTGHIASGPIVGTSERFIEWLKQRRDRKYIALEMESAGILNAAHTRHVSTLIIRGISDYGDQRKANLDKIFAGALRRYAMNNALALLWAFMDLQLMNIED